MKTNLLTSMFFNTETYLFVTYELCCCCCCCFCVDPITYTTRRSETDTHEEPHVCYCTGVQIARVLTMPVPWLDVTTSTTRSETTELTVSDRHSRSHYNTHTHNSSSLASLRLCTNKALILDMHSLNLYLPLPINT